MAKFAPVCPIHVARELDSWYSLGDYQLLLAHDILNKPDEYGELFDSQKNIPSKKYNKTWFETKILDNSVIELGSSVDIDVIAEAASIVKATVIVLPDVLLDAKATVESCLAALDTWTPVLQKKMGSQAWSYMVVPQGNTPEEWAWCAEQFQVAGSQIKWWGIPRNYNIKGLGSRRDAVQIAHAIDCKRRIHLLGFSDNIVDDVLSARMPEVDGIDSAVPLRAGSANLKMSMMLPELGPRGDWWDTVSIEDGCGLKMSEACDTFRNWIR